MFAALFGALGDIFQATIATLDGIPGESSTSKYQDFMSFSRKKKGDFSLSNIYTVQFSTPPMLNDKLESGDDRILLDYYCDSVNLPSKQITTAQIMNVGSAYKYATGNAFSQINMTFKIPRTQRTRAIFERWVAKMNNDANQYTHFYNMYCAPRVRIYKFERGGGIKVDNFAENTELFGGTTGSNNLLNYLKMDSSIKKEALDKVKNQAKFYSCHGMWELRNVFPSNIGSVQLNNNEARVMSLTISFNFERYRFYTRPQYSHGNNSEFIVKDPALRNNPQLSNFSVSTSTEDANGMGYQKGPINNDNWW
tara:strand:+ start:2470 stop:3396 length:927 start_codon:yes stop_codon:yes gene_type:complete